MPRPANAGKLYLIGAGPGDPDLLTVRAARVLAECDVLLYDRLVAPGVLALARPDAERIYVGKHEGQQEPEQARIFELLLDRVEAGKVVGRLKGGDPLVFGRGAEEWMLAAERGIEVEVVPGVTSAIALPGLAGIPVTLRGVSQSFAVITGHCAEGLNQKWASYVDIDTLVILMGVKNRAFIAQSLVAAGRDPAQPVAFIERGATPQQRIVESSLQMVAEGGPEVENPAVFVIGEAVAFRAGLARAWAVSSSAEPRRSNDLTRNL
jgi:uroporphyrin-III C-methyltransferase